jgi:hypothetical protein
MSFLRDVPGYDTTCDNLDMAILIAGHPDATPYEKAQAVAYVEAVAVSHIVLAEAITLAGYGALIEYGLIGGEVYDASQQCQEPPGQSPSPSFDDPMPVPTPAPEDGSSKGPVRNPYGRLGGPEHRQEVERVAAELEARGLDVEFEYYIRTPDGRKRGRFVDVTGIDPETGEPVEFHQIGEQTKKNQPVARERHALDDIEQATGIRPKFHPYNK